MGNMSSVNSLLREPIALFFVVGAILFAIYFVRDTDTEMDDGVHESPVTIAVSQLDHMELTWKQLSNRKPTDKELELLVNDFIREELLYREALALGLNLNDTVVRRRMAQKMAFLNKSGGVSNASDDVLNRWFEERKSDYAVSPTISFHQLYFSPEKRKDRIESDVSAFVEQLGKSRPESIDELPGDKSRVRNSWSHMTAGDLMPLFGEEFTKQIFDQDVGVWKGPVNSQLGSHAVFVSTKTQERLPAFEAVRGRVELDWMQEQARSANSKLMNDLIHKYGVEITSDARERLGELKVLGGGPAE